MDVWRCALLCITLIFTLSNGVQSSKQDVLSKLVDVFENEPEVFMKIATYLEKEEKAYENGDSPVWRTLQAAMKSDKFFKKYCYNLYKDLQEAESDETFNKQFSKMYEKMLPASDAPGHSGQRWAHPGFHTESLYPSLSQVWNRMHVDDKRKFLSSLSESLKYFEKTFWNALDAKDKEKLLHFLKKSAKNVPERIQLLWKNANHIGKNLKMDEVIEKTNSFGGKALIPLAVAHLSATAIKNIHRWWNSEISGKRCAKIIIDECVGIASGVGSGMLGAAICSPGGPAAQIVCSTAGSIIGEFVARTLSDRLTQYIFDIPKDEALENAYNFLEVKPTASNNEINEVFRKLCLKYDGEEKKGNKVKYIELQVHMTVIKAARNQ